MAFGPFDSGLGHRQHSFPMSVHGWAQLVEGLREAGVRLEVLVAQLDSTDRADGRRALVRALNNLLGRVEIDRDTPELVPFNGWREKFFMDNPNYPLLDHRHPL